MIWITVISQMADSYVLPDKVDLMQSGGTESTLVESGVNGASTESEPDGAADIRAKSQSRKDISGSKQLAQCPSAPEDDKCAEPGAYEGSQEDCEAKTITITNRNGDVSETRAR